MPPPAQQSSAVTRSIYVGTLAALVVVGTLSVVIFRSAVSDAVVQHSTQQLAMLRTASVGLQGEIQALSARLRQFNSLPSVQNLDVGFLGPRVDAAFADNPNGIVRYVIRIDAAGRLLFWTPDGEPGESSAGVNTDPERWRWMSDPANRGRVILTRPWWTRDPPEQLRALATPVWRTASSDVYPIPRNDFNGVLAIIIDVNRLADVYLGPALNDLAADDLVVGLGMGSRGVLMGPHSAGIRNSASDVHNHAEPQGTSILSDGDGRRIHAWSKFDAAGESWIVASSAPYGRVAASIQRSAMGQLLLTAALLVAVPLAGFLLARRERSAQEEQRRLARQLAESQKMEAIGKLAGGVAHDFNNMLTAILGYASLIHEDAPPSSPIREQASQIRRAAESAASLTQKLLAFSRRQVLQANQFDLVPMLDNLLVLVRRVIGENITVTFDAEPGLWPILADPVQVEQSIVNLAINSRDAMPDGGALAILARNLSRPRGEHRGDVEVRPGDYVQITVTDSGIGMDEATRARVFEPFFTTKPHGQGTGLGLSTVYGFVKQCGGFITVRSSPGAGTSIELLLPRALEPDPAAGPRTPASLLPEDIKPGRETILVVEDEDAVRALAVASLQRHGYRVLAAASGEEALRVADGFREPIDLLLTDVVMPGMKGPDLARRLKALRPTTRVLLMSGYAAEVVTSADLKDAPLLSKPFSSATLRRAVRAAIDHPPLSPRRVPTT
jgi:signal transduction histidine kinase/CheY-like chemotaxis protein